MLRSRQIAGPLSGIAAGVLAVTVAGAVAPAVAGAAVAPAGPASSTPASGTPELSPRPDGHTEQIRQLVQCGDMMYAVGKFARISENGRIYVRHNAFSFLAAAPYTVSSWKPGANGEVNSIAFKGSNCSSAYLGGSFTRVHKRRARNIVKVKTSTGAVRNRFRHDADRTVDTLVVHGRHVLAGGLFKSINGSGRNYYASLNSKTGRDDGYLRLRVSGHYDFPGVIGNRTRIYNQQLSPEGRRLLVEGDFTSVRGKHREQIFMLTLRAHRARVTKWRSPEFYGSCADNHPFYVTAASWSPDSSTVYVADTGYMPFNTSKTSEPRTGLCDAAAAFPSADRAVSSEWITYTGCYSLFSTAADASTAYFGGHEKYAYNPDGCKAPGISPTPIVESGMEGLSPSTGMPPTTPVYSKSPGLGADDMLVTDGGLWIASDNYIDKDGAVSDKCGGVAGHAGICFLPYP
jgi:hypothetical protein